MSRVTVHQVVLLLIVSSSPSFCLWPRNWWQGDIWKMFHLLNVPGGQRRLAEEPSEDAPMCPSLHPAAVKPRKLQTFLCVQKLFKNIRRSVLHCLWSISSDVLFMAHWWQVLNLIKGKLCCHKLCFGHLAEKNSSRQNKAGRREERVKDAPNKPWRQKTAKLKWTFLQQVKRAEVEDESHEAAQDNNTSEILPRRHCCSSLSHEEYYFTLWLVFNRRVKTGMFDWMMTLKPLRTRVHVARNQTGQKY